jgi:hypothetical protein
VGRQSAGNIVVSERERLCCVCVQKVAGSRSVGGRSVEESLQRRRQRVLRIAGLTIVFVEYI